MQLRLLRKSVWDVEQTQFYSLHSSHWTNRSSINQSVRFDESTFAKKSYSKKGDAVVELNYKAIDAGKDGIVEVTVDPAWAELPFDSTRKLTGDEYFDNHVAVINGLEGYDMPVSAFTGDFLLDGFYP